VATVRQRPIGSRSRPQSRGHRCRVGVEALEPAHEERRNGERATVGGADGGRKNRGGAHRGLIRGVRAPARCKLRGEVRALAREEGDAA
jgi:hypothetical protein